MLGNGEDFDIFSVETVEILVFYTMGIAPILDTTAGYMICQDLEIEIIPMILCLSLKETDHED